MNKMSGFVVAMTMSLLAIGSAVAETAGEVVDNSALQAKVKTALMDEDFVGGAEVNLETHKGVVQLGGFIDDAEKGEQLAKKAASVEGVAKVDNQLHLKPGKRSAGQSLDDKVITSSVKTKMGDADLGTGLNVNVDTYNGVVLLTGIVADAEIAKTVGKLAADVKNVKDVINGVYVAN